MKKNKVMIIAIISIIIAILAGIAIYIILGIKADPNTGNGDGNDRTSQTNSGDGENSEAGENQRASIPSTWDLEKVKPVYDEDGVLVPVPNGYTASSVLREVDSEGNVIKDGERTVNRGFVIYEGEEDIITNETKAMEDGEAKSAAIENDVYTAQTTRNQWVWVPVADINEIYGTNASGKKYGQLYNYNSTGRTKQSYSTTGYREPDILKSYDKSTYLTQYLTETSQDDLKQELQKEYEETIKSIKEYGGFYIGRYETGGLSKIAKVVKGNTDIASQNWYTMYKKSKALNGTKRNVRTSMIWGSLWYETLEWLVESENKTYGEITNSTTWGNYSNSEVDGHGSRRATGYSESWKANNIYDMAGNVWEWTLAVNYTDYRVYRGGGCYNSGSDDSVSSRRSNSPYYTSYILRLQSSTFNRVALSPNSDT